MVYDDSMAAPEYLICMECETPTYVFEWAGGKVIEAMCPVCGNDWHAEDCEFGKEVARRLKAEHDAHRMQFALHRLWPALERAMAGMVFTADRAGEVMVDMNTLREYSKTPNEKGNRPA